ncbi:MAG: hypothetical protein AB7F35_28090, partial [Acetobacteraceae bacterium]
MPGVPRTILKATAALLGVGVTGAAMTYLGGSADMLPAAYSFLGGIGGNATFSGLQDLFRTCRERPQGTVDENHVILRQLRLSQLDALRQLLDLWNRQRASDLTDGNMVSLRTGDAFNHALSNFLATEEEATHDLTWESLPDPPADGPLPAAVPAFDQALALRHGPGPALAQIGAPVSAAVWSELRTNVSVAIPDSFRILFDAPQGGFFALYVGAAARRLRDNPDFARIWNAEQVAVIRYLVGETAVSIVALEKAAAQATETLQRQATLLDAIDGRGAALHDAMRDMHERLFGNDTWLEFPTVAAHGWLRFSRYNTAIPFVGRANILRDLNTFLMDDRDFLWWGITGPGGAGKSRLAAKLCLLARAQGWHVGFRRTDASPDRIDGWEPSAPTLVIADYVNEHTADIRATALKLARKAHGGKPVIRLVLLERQLDDPFWRAFLSGHQRDQGTLTGSRYRDDMLALPPLSDDELWALVQSRPWRLPAEQAPLPTPRETFFARLGEIDANRRALVAMLLADAPDLTGDLGTVLDELIRRSRTFWPQPMPPDADMIIAAATMLGILTDDSLRALGDRLGRAITVAGDLRPCARALGATIHRDAQRLDLTGIEPDLIGEFFVLNQLLPLDQAADPTVPTWLPVLCWGLAPDRMAAFCVRAFSNFPAHPGIPALTPTPPPTAAIAEAYLAMTWAISAVEAGRLPWLPHDALTRRAQGIDARTHDSAVARLALASTLFNTLYHAKDEGDTARRDALLQDLRALAAAWPDDPAVRKQLAMGLLNTLNHAKDEGDTARRDALLQDLRALAAAWPDDPAVREQLAMGLFNTLNHAK